MPELVSVVITCHNAARWVRAAVDSILAQTYAALECLVVDDGSTDGTLDTLADIADPRLRRFRPGRLGRGRALNYGIARARGALVAIQDADDLSHARRLEIEVGVLAAHPEISVLGSGQQLLWGDTASLEWTSPVAGAVRNVGALLPLISPVSHTSLIVRREALAAVGGYDERRRELFDFDLLVRLAALGRAPYRYSRPLVAKRIHAAQQFERARRLRYVMSGARLHYRALRNRGGSGLLLPVLAGVLVYRLFPARLRLSLRDLTGRWAA